MPLGLLAGLAHSGLPFAAPVDLTGNGHYLSWGFLQVSVANLVVIAVIAAMFAGALLLPFPGSRKRER